MDIDIDMDKETLEAILYIVAVAIILCSVVGDFPYEDKIVMAIMTVLLGKLGYHDVLKKVV